MEKSQTDKLDRKGWREYLKGIIIKFVKIIYSFIKWIFRYSGLEFIYRKFNPSKDPQPLPTGVVWIVGIYVAFFGVASQRYENRIDIIENRANSIFNQLAVSSVQKKALSRISAVQNMSCPQKPDILNPLSVFNSLFTDITYREMVIQLKEIIEDWKDSLDFVYLGHANLDQADLFQATLQNSSLNRASLVKAILIKANMKGANLVGANLEKALIWQANLHSAKLDRANLKEADLGAANLHGAILYKTNLQGANLQHANFMEAQLESAVNLTVVQICEAETLYLAKLDPEFEKQIKEKCPRLLKKPQKNIPDEKK